MVRAILASTVVFLSLAVAVRAERPRIVDAAKSGDREAVRALVQARANVNAADADGTTALHWASYRDDLESDLGACVALFVARLPAPYRQAVTLSELEGLTHKDAAELLADLLRNRGCVVHVARDSAEAL